MTELNELYQEVILDHTKHPRNKGKLEGANHSAEGYNPLCGDRVHLDVLVDGNTIKDLRFDGSGCAISTASVSLLTECIKGKTTEQFEKMFEKFHTLVTTSMDLPTDTSDLDKLVVFEGVREFPMRVKCATLSWHTLKAALENKPEAITTEE